MANTQGTTTHDGSKGTREAMFTAPPRTDTAGPPILATSDERGKTEVSDDVVTTIARIAAEQVEGVHHLGTTGLRGMIARIGSHPGVDSEVGSRQAAITLEVVVEYGARLTDVARDLRTRVIEAVEYMAGRQVVAVDIHFVDVHVPKKESRPGRALE